MSYPDIWLQGHRFVHQDGTCNWVGTHFTVRCIDGVHATWWTAHFNNTRLWDKGEGPANLYETPEEAIEAVYVEGQQKFEALNKIYGGVL